MRSLLYTPGSNKERLLKAWNFKPDAVIIDLEDSVPEEKKEEARKNAQEILETYENNWFVRVNSINSDHIGEDLKYIIKRNLKGIILPKVTSKSDILYVSKILEEYIKQDQSFVKEVKIIPLIESAKGFINLREIATSSSKIEALGFGGGDFSLDLGIQWDPFSPLIEYLKIVLVIESRNAGLAPPHDTVYPNYKDIEGLKRNCYESRKIGFGAKHAIHPDQIPIINEIFSPTPEEIKWAQEVKDTFEKALKEGKGSVGIRGMMIDIPIYKNALRILEKVEKQS